MSLEPWSDYELNAPDPSKSRDLDETRRLLYMSLYAARTKRYALAGTLVNALAHHGAGIPREVSEGYVLAIVEGEGIEAGSGSAAQVYPMARDWVEHQIKRITELLD